jgi:hypothetical protein
VWGVSKDRDQRFAGTLELMGIAAAKLCGIFTDDFTRQKHFRLGLGHEVS